MTPRRRDFRLASSSDDESYQSKDTARRSAAEARRKSRRPRRGGREKARLLRCRAILRKLAEVDTPRPSASDSGLFPPIAGSLGLQAEPWELKVPPRSSWWA